MEDVLERMEAMVQARVESALMGPARRPPLAHEVRSAPVELPVQGGYVVGSSHPPSGKGKGVGKGKRAAKPAPAPLTPTPVAGPSSAPPRVEAPGPSGAAPQAVPAGPVPRRAAGAAEKKPRERRTGGAKKPVPPPQQAPREPRPLPPAPASMDREWTVVVGKRKKPRSGAAPAASPQQPPRRAEPKIRPPRSAAVIISLTPAAVSKGLTYKQVLTEAQGKVDLTGLDIGRLRPKFTATGAPMYEVPGANSEEFAQAQALLRREAEGVLQWVGGRSDLPAH
ncbi:proline-rich protein HaeIII subfamily 1-like [Manduca sexta]|uniref:proline-rich protein HaeIII subfamily 1-like n=1 Tax=Manduca sexta TaxID=7130 RepID=UPI00188E0DD7|nr:proline-rich protein HaeIII subfamily 1-like [Manduca sexta]